MRKNIFIACLVLLMQAVLCAQDLTAVRELKQLWKYDEATALLSEMIREQGPQPALLEELADCHYQSGNTAGALELYTQLSGLLPDKLLYKLRLMSLLYRGKQYEPVIALGRDVLQRDSITQVLSLVGDAFNQLERRDSAEWYYRRALARKPHNESVLNKLSGILLGRERYDEVLSMTDTFLSEEPDNLTILPVSGVAHFSKGEYTKAEAAFMRMNRLGEDGYAVHYYLGQCAQKIGIPADAMREYRLAWQRDSSDVGLALTIGQMMADYRGPGWEKWYDKALEMLSPDQRTIANTIAAHQNYALSAYRNGRWDLCIEQYGKLLEINPRHYAAFYMIAQCYEYKKDYKTALNWFKRAQGAFAPGTRGRDIADGGVERMTAELFFRSDPAGQPQPPAQE